MGTQICQPLILCPFYLLRYQKLTKAAPTWAPHSLISCTHTLAVTGTSGHCLFCFVLFCVVLFCFVLIPFIFLQIKKKVASLGSEKGFVALGEIKPSIALNNLKNILPRIYSSRTCWWSWAIRLIILSGQVVHFPSNTTVSLQKRQNF